MLVNAHIRTAFLLIGFLLPGGVSAQTWSLQQCVDTARAYNKNLMISRNNQAISEQRSREAQAALLPKVNLNADYRYYTSLPYQLMPMSVFGGPEGQYKEAQFGVSHNMNTSVQISMPLYNSQVNGAIRSTRIANEASSLQHEKTEEQLYFEIYNAYYNAQILQSQLRFVSHNLANTNKLLAMIRLLREQSMAKGSDVDKIALQADQLATRESLLKIQYELVLNSLKFLMGVSLDMDLRIHDSIDVDTDVVEYDENLSTDIRLAEIQRRLSASEMSTAKNSRLPSIALYGTFGTTGFGYEKTSGDFFEFYPLGFAGVQFTYPIFDGLSTRRRIRQKSLDLSNSQLKLDVLREQNRMQIDNARKQMVIAKSTMANTLSQISLAQSIYDQSVLQQKVGTATLTDVLAADNSLQEAQQAYISSLIDYLKTDLELKKVTGNILKK